MPVTTADVAHRPGLLLPRPVNERIARGGIPERLFSISSERIQVRRMADGTSVGGCKYDNGSSHRLLAVVAGRDGYRRGR